MMGRLITVTVPCPDCGHPADAMFGDHHGLCLDGRTPPGSPRRAMTGADVVREWASRHEFLSINEVRPAMVKAGVPESRRGPAFGVACRRGWIEQVGHQPSTGERTKGHDVKTYRSLICRAAREAGER